jgi:hypothetical protein
VAKRLPKAPKSKRRTLRRVTLGDLASFKINAIEPTANGSFDLSGEFTHLKGVRLEQDTDRTVGFLYRSRRDSIYLLLRKFDLASQTATFHAWPAVRRPRVGESLPYVDYYWSPKEVAFALEPASCWKCVKFKSLDSVQYSDPAVPGWRTTHVASHPPPPDASNIQVIKNGWDHEHCYLCKSRIGRAGNRWGYYSKTDKDWLCISCYKKFVARHDLCFLQFKS